MNKEINEIRKTIRNETKTCDLKIDTNNIDTVDLIYDKNNKEYKILKSKIIKDEYPSLIYYIVNNNKPFAYIYAYAVGKSALIGFLNNDKNLKYKGIITNGLKYVVEDVFLNSALYKNNEESITNIKMAIDLTNKSSLAVAKNCGFKYLNFKQCAYLTKQQYIESKNVKQM